MGMRADDVVGAIPDHHGAPRIAKHRQGSGNGVRLTLALHAQIGTGERREEGPQPERVQQRLRECLRLRRCDPKPVSLGKLVEDGVYAWSYDGLPLGDLGISGTVAREARRHERRIRRVFRQLRKRVGERRSDEAMKRLLGST